MNSRILPSLMLVLGFLLSTKAGAQPVGAPATLTVDQTLQAVYLGIPDGQEDSLFNVYIRANRAAKPQLFALLEDETKVQYFHNILLMIAYIGEADDVGKIEGLLGKYSGLLSEPEKVAVEAVFRSLGIMHRRGINEAGDKLDQMLKREYWTKHDLRWWRENTGAATSNLDETIARVLTGYAYSGKADISTKYTSVISESGELQKQQTMKLRIPIDRLTAIDRLVREAESRALRPAILNWLSSKGTSTTDPNPPSDTVPSVLDLLSIEQTVAAAHLPLGSPSGFYNVFRRANPAAKAEVYRILDDKKNERFIANAFMILGYIGDASDVPRLERILTSYFGRDLSGLERNSISALFRSLGIMSRRNVAGASQKLDEMLQQNYWDKRDLRWFPANIRTELTAVNEIRSQVLQGYAFSGHADILEKRSALIASINDVDQRRLMEQRNEPAPLTELAARIVREEARDITTNELGLLSQTADSLAVRSKDRPAKEPTADADRNETAERQGADSGGSDSPTIDFRSAVEAEFEAWFAATAKAQALAASPGYSPESDEARRITGELEAAYRDFEAAVRKYWPYSTEESEAASAKAAEAIQFARNFSQNQYVEGMATRDEAVAHWLEVAERFPNSVERDEALSRAAMLYLQQLRNGAKADYDTAQKLFAQAVSRPGPPNRWTLTAEESLISFPDDSTQRMTNRSDMYLRLGQLKQLKELKAQVLVPSPTMTPERFLREIDSLLITIDTVRDTAAKNMVNDGRQRRWRQNRAVLLERHSGDKLVELEISKVPLPPD
jgi:hypothetical protein